MSRFLYRNLELLEPYEGKLSRTVLRGKAPERELTYPTSKSKKALLFIFMTTNFPTFRR